MIERDAQIEGVSGCPGVGGVCTVSRLSERLQVDGRDLGFRAKGICARACATRPVEPLLRAGRTTTETALGTDCRGLIFTPGISLYMAGNNWVGLNLY